MCQFKTCLQSILKTSQPSQNHTPYRLAEGFVHFVGHKLELAQVGSRPKCNARFRTPTPKVGHEPAAVSTGQLMNTIKRLSKTCHATGRTLRLIWSKLPFGLVDLHVERLKMQTHHLHDGRVVGDARTSWVFTYPVQASHICQHYQKAHLLHQVGTFQNPLRGPVTKRVSLASFVTGS